MLFGCEMFFAEPSTAILQCKAKMKFVDSENGWKLPCGKSFFSRWQKFQQTDRETVWKDVKVKMR